MALWRRGHRRHMGDGPIRVIPESIATASTFLPPSVLSLPVFMLDTSISAARVGIHTYEVLEVLVADRTACPTDTLIRREHAAICCGTVFFSTGRNESWDSCTVIATVVIASTCAFAV